MKKIIENSDLNSLRWNALCDGVTSLYKYRYNISSMQFYLPLSAMCEAVASGMPYDQEYVETEENTLGL